MFANCSQSKSNIAIKDLDILHGWFPGAGESSSKSILTFIPSFVPGTIKNKHSTSINLTTESKFISLGVLVQNEYIYSNFGNCVKIVKWNSGIWQ